ncbi:hypothetical protein [Sphingomonas sp.]|uniref:hypothetical protein n=1 Tax=Sphingomonas sp. TaxID=28214 RepID=UPI0025EF499C|nr:hypothetical protein [Sphingomonas sp.]MBV9528246.1 hypothetical protein [Sphingomonas sp.]
MPVVQQGQINTNSLFVPDVYVQIVPPAQLLLNGVATNILGIVGVGSWGPVNSPVTVGNPTDAVLNFGSVKNRKYDLVTACLIAIINGANNIRAVRVTDGTDAAASGVLGSTGITFTGKYTGTVGNSIVASLAPGTAANSWRATIALPGIVPEVFDNLAVGLSGNAVWVAIAAAINGGSSGLRGPSNLVVAAAGSSTSAPTSSSVTLSGGTDGAATITGSVLIGQDSTPRKGMYALRNTGASIAMLADCDDSTTYSAQAAFALSEGVYMIAVGPAGDTVANAASTKATAGLDCYGVKLLLGDWILWLDTTNNVTRLISPQASEAGFLSALSPEQSSLNKQQQGIVGTQKSTSGSGVNIYSEADLQTLAQAGIDVIANPCPGGAYFGSRIGCNTSSNAVINGDNYTRLTNYIAYSLNAGMGKYIGRLQSASVRAQALATLNAFLSNMWQQGMIGDVNNPQNQPFSVQINAANNPPSRVALGYMQADVTVVYQSIITKLLINVMGGQSVQVTVASSTPQ